MAQNINFAVPTSYFVPYVDKKKKSNTKNLNWTDFVVSTLKEKDLSAFMDYAMTTENRTMMYKFMKGLLSDEEVESDDYSLYGSIAMLAYMDTSGSDNVLLNDALKWFALSINSNKNIELSSYGLILGSMLSGNVDNFDIYYDYLKKYSKSRKVLDKQLNSLFKCDTKDSDCIDKYLYDMGGYLNYLAKNIYRSKKTNG